MCRGCLAGWESRTLSPTLNGAPLLSLALYLRVHNTFSFVKRSLLLRNVGKITEFFLAPRVKGQTFCVGTTNL